MHEEQLVRAISAAEHGGAEEVAHGGEGKFDGSDHAYAVCVERNRYVLTGRFEEGGRGVVQGLSANGVKDNVDGRKLGKLLAERRRRIVKDLRAGLALSLLLRCLGLTSSAPKPLTISVFGPEQLVTTVAPQFFAS